MLPDLLAALRHGNGAVLVAPPGAGKTTAVAPALLGEAWCDGTILLLSPRRVAARGAAERMAAQMGERAGETVGYLTRLDSKQSSRTRILVITEAIFVNRILDDPELPGVSAVLFDEAHERHLDSDFGLALALESRAVLRGDMRILVMSATIDGARFAALLGNGTAVIESEGRAHPLRIEWLGAKPELRLEDQMVSAIKTAWREQDGDILAFLPGAGEIERVRERLSQSMPRTPILPLHGQVEPSAQQAAIKLDAEGRRRIVLATSIAETSLTLEGVSVVVDSDLSRRAEFDHAAGANRLVTVRASQAAADQRAGRAARLGPGVAYRLWEEGGHGGRPQFDPPEIASVDLAPLVLSLARWGSGDPGALAWLDAPPAASLASARQRLEQLGALDETGLTPFGEQLAQLPMDPAQAAMVLYGAQAGAADTAAQIALLLQERGLGGRGEDLLQRLQSWHGDRSRRAKASRKLASRWAKSADGLLEAQQSSSAEASAGIFLAKARPDFVAKRRDGSGENWQSVGGRGFFLDPTSPLCRAEWLAIGDAQGSARGARITAAIALDTADVERALGHLIDQRETVCWNVNEVRVEARLERRLGNITLTTGPHPDPNAEMIEKILLSEARKRIQTLVPPALLPRARYAGIDALRPDALSDSADQWLAPILVGRRNLDLAAGKLAEAALGMLDWNDRQRLDAMAPRQWTSPADTRHNVDYAAEAGPTVEVRVQALFGLDRHPMVGDTPLLLQLTSPAGRPIQSTRDLPGFWRGSWADVCKDMKGRYPRHRWPAEPWREAPSLKTKNAFSKTRS